MNPSVTTTTKTPNSQETTDGLDGRDNFHAYSDGDKIELPTDSADDPDGVLDDRDYTDAVKRALTFADAGIDHINVYVWHDVEIDGMILDSGATFHVVGIGHGPADGGVGFPVEIRDPALDDPFVEGVLNAYEAGHIGLGVFAVGGDGQ